MKVIIDVDRYSDFNGDDYLDMDHESMYISDDCNNEFIKFSINDENFKEFFLINKEGLRGGIVGSFAPPQYMAILDAFEKQSKAIMKKLEGNVEELMKDIPPAIREKLDEVIKGIVENRKEDAIEEIDLELDVPENKKKKADYIG